MSGMPSGRPIDVSVTIRPRMPIYEGDPGVAVEQVKSIDRGDPANVSRLELGAHTGTHVDAPRHFLPGGAGADELPLDPFVGPCSVVDAHGARGAIDAACIDAVSLRVPPRARARTHASRAAGASATPHGGALAAIGRSRPKHRLDGFGRRAAWSAARLLPACSVVVGSAK